MITLERAAHPLASNKPLFLVGPLLPWPEDEVRFTPTFSSNPFSGSILWENRIYSSTEKCRLQMRQIRERESRTQSICVYAERKILNRGPGCRGFLLKLQSSLLKAQGPAWETGLFSARHVLNFILPAQKLFPGGNDSSCSSHA